jgi:hypothetical protein
MGLFQKGSIPWNKGIHKSINNCLINWRESGGKRIGYRPSEATKLKISITKKNNPTKYWLGKKRDDMRNERHWAWKGEKATYGSLHSWVRRILGKIKECVYCGNEKRIEWASISHHASRNLEDYIPLCVPCHREYDKKGRL